MEPGCREEAVSALNWLSEYFAIDTAGYTSTGRVFQFRVVEGLVELTSDFSEHVQKSFHVSGKAFACWVEMVIPGVSECLPLSADVAMAMAPGVRGAAADGQEAAQGAADVEGLERLEVRAVRPSMLSTIFPGYFRSSFLVAISGLQCLAFVATLLMSHSVLPSTCSLYLLGASWAPGLAAGEFWRLGVPVLLHASLPHLVANIIFQLRLGFSLEHHLGSLRFGVLYLLSGVFGNVISAACTPLKLAVGASTSGLGLVGAHLALLALLKGQGAQQQRFWLTYIGIILAGLFFGAHTDMFGHVGGLLGGLLLMFVLHPRSGSIQRYTALTTILISATVSGAQISTVAREPIMLHCPPLFP